MVYNIVFMIAQETFDEIQSQNLNNVEVATTIGSGMGMIDVAGRPYKSNTLYTNIHHYHMLKLSTILNFFGRMGIKHVNIIEHSCRVFGPKLTPPEHIQRQTSETEKERGANMTVQFKEKNMGGKRDLICYTKKSRLSKNAFMSR